MCFYLTRFGEYVCIVCPGRPLVWYALRGMHAKHIQARFVVLSRAEAPRRSRPWIIPAGRPLPCTLTSGSPRLSRISRVMPFSTVETETMRRASETRKPKSTCLISLSPCSFAPRALCSRLFFDNNNGDDNDDNNISTGQSTYEKHHGY